MRPPRTASVICFSVVLGLAASLSAGPAAAKDDARIEPTEPGSIVTAPLAPLRAPGGEPANAAPHLHLPTPGDNQPFQLPADDGRQVMPEVRTVELTLDMAVKALNALEDVRDKYNDQGIEAYETLEEFVAKTSAGKRLEADIKSFGFKDITEWNAAISAVGFAFDALTSDQEAHIRMEIDEVREDTSMDAADREQTIRSLEAMLPSENNKAIVRDLINDPANRYKLRLLDERE